MVLDPPHKHDSVKVFANPSMETPAEYQESQVRRFYTTLWIARARRHLQTLAKLYGWSPETLAAHETTFIRPPPMRKTDVRDL